jgi:hypothetical protein
LPAKTNGNVSRNLYHYYSKVIERLQRVCVGLELPCIFNPPPPPTLRFFAFYTYCLRHYETDPFFFLCGWVQKPIICGVPTLLDFLYSQFVAVRSCYAVVRLQNLRTGYYGPLCLRINPLKKKRICFI